MPMLIFEVTDKNKIIGLNPKSFEVWRMKASQEEADVYRKKIKEEIIPRVYFNKMPGEVIGSLTIAAPIIRRCITSYS